MNEGEIFLNELLAEVEAKEEQQTEAYYDLLLMQIQQMQEQIAHNFSESAKEVEIINQWALNKNHALQTKVEWLELKLEYYIKERKEKTIDLAHGVLKFHKKPDKVEITDMQLFLANASSELLTVVPEQVKPDLSKIKQYTKTHPVPKGVTVVPGVEEFSYKLNERKDNENGRQEKTGTSFEYANSNRIAV